MNEEISSMIKTIRWSIGCQNSFLNGNWILHDFQGNENILCLLNKSISGFKKAARPWNQAVPYVKQGWFISQ